MRAIVIRESGGPEKLLLENVEEPQAGEGELLVSVTAAGLNFIDTYQRRGLYPIDMPFTPGLEGAGTVVDVGADAGGFSPGDQVGWTDVIGSYAELIRLPVSRAIAVPSNVPEKVVAAVLLQGLTAHYLVTDTYPLSEGDRCLIHAGAGGVGLLLTQMAKAKGAEVITTVGSANKEEASRAAGSDMVINYSDQDFKEAVEERYGPNSLHVVYDGVGAATFERGLDLLRLRGMMVTFGSASGPAPDIAPLTLAQKGSLFLTRPTLFHHVAGPGELQTRADDVLSQADSGSLTVLIGAEYPLEKAADAHRALEGRETMGKVLILP